MLTTITLDCTNDNVITGTDHLFDVDSAVRDGGVRFPGHTVVRDSLDLGVAVVSPSSLGQGTPLDTVQRLDDSLLIEQRASVTNPPAHLGSIR